MLLNHRSLHPALGVAIEGVDLRGELDAATLSQIQRTFYENGVVLFRGQSLTESDHVRFARRIGELEIHFLKQYLHPQHPELLILSNVIENGKPIGAMDAGQYWHTDLSYAAAPCFASILRSVKAPVENGVVLGDTLFASMFAAYDALPATMQKRLAGLKAAHRYGDRFKKTVANGAVRAPLTKDQRAVPDAVHPVIRTHPVTGRKCIYVNEGFTDHIVGLPADESRSLLDELFEHATRPGFIYRHKWQQGDLLMWDNVSTQHNAIGDYGTRPRIMQKATVAGSIPF